VMRANFSVCLPMVGTWFLDQFRDCDLNGDVVVNWANDSVWCELLSISNTRVEYMR
jgi:hypothetical protein